MRVSLIAYARRKMRVCYKEEKPRRGKFWSSHNSLRNGEGRLTKFDKKFKSYY